ncbi:MAG: ABC transporter substrate-binding protein [Planctomycetota bacterium]|jgi:ABC-type transport system substrate-binding protein
MKKLLYVFPLLGVLAFASLNTGCGTASQLAAEDGDEVVIRRHETGDPRYLDPHRAGDVVSSRHTGLAYETLFEYHYLTRTPILVPSLAAKMPTYDKATRTYTFTVRDDIYFSADRCFHDDAKDKHFKSDGEGDLKQSDRAKGRKLVAADFAYSLKRLAALNDGGFWVIEGQIQGLDSFRNEALSKLGEGPADDPNKHWREHLMNAEVDGIKVIDDRTYKVTLTKDYPQFLYAITLSYGAAVAHEAANYYREDLFWHPVGTGPFVLKKWRKNMELIWERNPDFRDIKFPGFQDVVSDETKMTVADTWKGHEKEFDEVKSRWGKLVGTKLPVADRVDFSIIKESQASWLSFNKGLLDVSGISMDQFDTAISHGEVTGELEEKGIWLKKYSEPTIHYISFNMNDPVVGTPAGDRGKAIRQAMCNTIDRKDYIRRYLNERGQPADQLVPPNVNGRQPENTLKNQVDNPEKGREILKNAGFRLEGNGDKWKCIDPATNKQLTLNILYRSTDTETARRAQFMANCVERIGIKIEAEQVIFREFLRRQDEGNGQCYDAGWVMDYPDAQNMLQLLYGPNKPPGINSAAFDHPEYNRLYTEMSPLDDSNPVQLKKKNDLIRQMHEILDDECPWILVEYRVVFSLRQNWLLPPPVANSFNYVSIKYHSSDSNQRAEKAEEWEETNYIPLILFLLFAGSPAALMIFRITKEK